jgi:hypothetical protein
MDKVKTFSDEGLFRGEIEETMGGGSNGLYYRFTIIKP